MCHSKEGFALKPPLWKSSADLLYCFSLFWGKQAIWIAAVTARLLRVLYSEAMAMNGNKVEGGGPAGTVWTHDSIYSQLPFSLLSALIMYIVSAGPV